MDFVGNALAPNALTIGQDLEALSASMCACGRAPLDYVYPNRAMRRLGQDATPEERRRAAGLLAVEEAYGPVGLQASFGYGPFLDDRSRAMLFAPAEESPYEAVRPQNVSALFSQAGIVGPTQPGTTASGLPSGAQLLVYAVSPFVIMVDRAALGDLAVPHSWEELLDGRYRGRVVLTAEDPVSNVASLGLHALYGDAALDRLFSNVAYSASASIMGLVAGSASAGRGALFVAPWFFARICSTRPGVEVVWPREGALVFPLWLALRKDAGPAARSVASYFLSDDFARKSAALCMPCANAASDACVPGYPDESRNLAWVGWDYLHNLDVESYEARALRAASGLHQARSAQEARSL